MLKRCRADAVKQIQFRNWPCKYNIYIMKIVIQLISLVLHIVKIGMEL